MSSKPDTVERLNTDLDDSGFNIENTPHGRSRCILQLSDGTNRNAIDNIVVVLEKRIVSIFCFSCYSNFDHC